ncbi:MAG: hypothetical protein LBI39_04025 [Puniceicoccales bacterium]|jgi:hypothetical protein|nr:hypothetical protein [Puniceicoccales bacterium]
MTLGEKIEVQAEPFLVRVGPSGLPHWATIGEASGDESISGLRPAVLAHCYWMLRSISVSYAYEISSFGVLSNCYDVSCEIVPQQRLLAGPTFFGGATSGANGMFSEFYVDLSAATVEPDGTYALNFYICEGTYPYMEVVLSTELRPTHETIAVSSATIFGRAVPLYLQVESSFDLSGSISSFSLAAAYWEISA